MDGLIDTVANVVIPDVFRKLPNLVRCYNKLLRIDSFQVSYRMLFVLLWVAVAHGTSRFR